MNTEKQEFYSQDECLTVQMDGFDACDKCNLKDTKECGGKEILKTKKNKLGYIVNKHGVTESKNNEQKKAKKRNKNKKRKKR